MFLWEGWIKTFWKKRKKNQFSSQMCMWLAIDLYHIRQHLECQSGTGNLKTEAWSPCSGIFLITQLIALTGETDIIVFVCMIDIIFSISCQCGTGNLKTQAWSPCSGIFVINQLIALTGETDIIVLCV